MFKDDANKITNKPRSIQITSCNWTHSCPGSNSSTTEVLANSELQVEQRNSVNGKHYKVRYEEGGWQQREMYLLSLPSTVNDPNRPTPLPQAFNLS